MRYRVETWCLSKQVESKLRSVQRVMERRVIGVMLRGSKRASWIRVQT